MFVFLSLVVVVVAAARSSLSSPPPPPADAARRLLPLPHTFSPRRAAEPHTYGTILDDRLRPSFRKAISSANASLTLPAVAAACCYGTSRHRRHLGVGAVVNVVLVVVYRPQNPPPPPPPQYCCCCCCRRCCCCCCFPDRLLRFERSSLALIASIVRKETTGADKKKNGLFVLFPAKRSLQ